MIWSGYPPNPTLASNIGTAFPVETQSHKMRTANSLDTNIVYNIS